MLLQARYDEELKVYLKTTGLRSSDLVKQKPKKSKPSAAQQRRPAAPPASMPPARQTAAVPADLHLQQPQQHAQVTANHHQQQQQQQQLQVKTVTLASYGYLNYYNVLSALNHYTAEHNFHVVPWNLLLAAEKHGIARFLLHLYLTRGFLGSF